MKKILFVLFAITAVSCNSTSISQDTQMLQEHYSTVYRVDGQRYITADSLHVYDIRVTLDGQIYSIVKIK
jgi:hypothetical protein